MVTLQSYEIILYGEIQYWFPAHQSSTKTIEQVGRLLFSLNTQPCVRQFLIPKFLYIAKLIMNKDQTQSCLMLNTKYLLLYCKQSWFASLIVQAEAIHQYSNYTKLTLKKKKLALGDQEITRQSSTAPAVRSFD